MKFSAQVEELDLNKSTDSSSHVNRQVWMLVDPRKGLTAAQTINLESGEKEWGWRLGDYSFRIGG